MVTRKKGSLSCLFILICALIVLLTVPGVAADWGEASKECGFLERILARAGAALGIPGLLLDDNFDSGGDTTTEIVSIEIKPEKIKIDGMFSPGEYDGIVGKPEGTGWSADIGGEDWGSVYTTLTKVLAVLRGGGDSGPDFPGVGGWSAASSLYLFNLTHNIVKLQELKKPDYNKFIFTFKHTSPEVRLIVWVFQKRDYTGDDLVWLAGSGILDLPGYGDITEFDDRGFFYCLDDGNTQIIKHWIPGMMTPNDPNYWQDWCVYANAGFNNSAYSQHNGQLPGAQNDVTCEVYELTVLLPPPYDEPGDLYIVKLDEEDPEHDRTYNMRLYWEGLLYLKFPSSTSASQSRRFVSDGMDNDD